MENNVILFILAMIVGLILQIVVRFSGRSRKRSVMLILNILKYLTLFCVQIFLIFYFSSIGGENTSHGSCIAASCVTFGIGIAILLLQFLFGRKYPLSDEQRMHLSEI